jgi:hypothetical protein
VLAVPALVYVVGLGVHEATTVSLAVVAGVAATGAIGQVFIGFRTHTGDRAQSRRRLLIPVEPHTRAGAASIGDLGAARSSPFQWLR